LQFVRLIYCIFGPAPFRPVPTDPSWLTPTVTNLAQAIYDDRVYERMPILADALEDAGCTNQDILNHCRQPGEHVRGCWVTDLLTGRECAVFTRQELMAELPRVVAVDTPPLEVVEFGHQDFELSRWEQSIRAFRGAKRDFPSGLLFWVKTLQAQGWEGRQSYFVPYAEAGLCTPVTAAEFARLVAEYTGSLRRPLPPFLTEFGAVRSGLRMYAEWNDVAAMVELPDAFVAFYWSTTA
jgi:hypothetical protein